MKVLFGVFDWGLGHATRDLPIIKALIAKGHDIDIVSTGKALKLLKIELKTSCRYHDLPSVLPLYSKNFSNFVFATKIPELLKQLKELRKISKKLIKNGNYDKVISDCRFDIYDKKENSYLINHQLRFNIPISVAEKPIEKLLSEKMKKYRYILVPDFRKKNLTGKLSHNLNYLEKDQIKYIGILSHIKNKPYKKDIDYFVSLSGPQASKKRLLKKILRQAKHLDGKVVVVGGNPETDIDNNIKNIEFHSFANSEQQEEFMNRAKFVIIRGGYTTIMELAELDIKNVIVIPSPNHSEQEYLAKLYEKNKIFHSASQLNLNLKKSIVKARKYNGFLSPWKTKQSVEKILKLTGL